MIGIGTGEQRRRNKIVGRRKVVGDGNIIDLCDTEQGLHVRVMGLGGKRIGEENNDIDSDLKSYIEDMIEKRVQYKKEKNFEMADKIREELKEKGIIIQDTREGTVYEIIG